MDVSAGRAAAAPVVPGVAPAGSAVKLIAQDVSDLGATQAAGLVNQAKSEGFAVFQLDGARMTTKPALLAHAAQVLHLPGNTTNWDALIDNMGDMPQIHCNDKLLIVIKNSSLIQRANPQLYADLREVAQLSSRRVRDTNNYPVTIKFVFVP
ncbi:MAG: barstar family protein [Elusimicrobia bacterium]|nr:barstar family protein [Elusimicrobiota bacterium]